MDARKTVLRETGFIAAGEIVCVCLMDLVFYLAGAFDRSVLLGSILGLLLAVGNFLFMAISASQALDQAAAQNVSQGKSTIRASYIFRMLVIVVILFAAVQSGACNVLASVFPLLFVRWIIMVTGFFRKDAPDTNALNSQSQPSRDADDEDNLEE
ncbi:MAG: ATP synthase subunit I [Clostridia bacterium]|nr:ATP synthase subunit I [Clostridia bacterium]